MTHYVELQIVIRTLSPLPIHVWCKASLCFFDSSYLIFASVYSVIKLSLYLGCSPGTPLQLYGAHPWKLGLQMFRIHSTDLRQSLGTHEHTHQVCLKTRHINLEILEFICNLSVTTKSPRSLAKTLLSGFFLVLKDPLANEYKIVINFLYCHSIINMPCLRMQLWSLMPRTRNS